MRTPKEWLQYSPINKEFQVQDIQEDAIRSRNELLRKAVNVLTEFGSIDDQSRVGWLLTEIDAALGTNAK